MFFIARPPLSGAVLETQSSQSLFFLASHSRLRRDALCVSSEAGGEHCFIADPFRVTIQATPSRGGG